MARVFDELAEPARFLGLQPLLTAVHEVGSAAGTRAFAATERVPVVGPFALSSRLRVELRPDADGKRVAFATRAPLGIRLRGAFETSWLRGSRRAISRMAVSPPFCLKDCKTY